MLITVEHEGATLSNFTPQAALDAGVAQADVDAAVNALLTRNSDQGIDHVLDRVFTLSPSRVKRYDEKYQEALAFRDAEYPAGAAAADYPYVLGGEAAARGLTAQEHCDAIIAKAEAFQAFGAQGETARAQAKAAIEAAGTIEEKQAAANAAIEAMRQAAAPLMA